MELEKCVNRIMELRGFIHKEDLWGDPGKLSDLMIKIGVWNNYLSDHIPRLHKEATDVAFKHFKANLNEKGGGVSKAEQLARGLSTDERQNYEQAKILYSATENLLSQLQSRLRVIENQTKAKY